GGEFFQRGGLEAGSHDTFHKKLGQFFGGGRVEFAVHRDHAAEGGNRITFQRLPVRVNQRVLLRRSGGVVVLDDGHCGPVKFGDQRPGRVQVDQIVVGKFLALQL